MIAQAKLNYYTDKIAHCNRDQRSIFQVIRELSNVNNERILPRHGSAQELAGRFSDFFITKIIRIHESLASSLPPEVDATPTPEVEQSPCEMPLESFYPATLEEVTKIIKTSPTKSCALDPIPTTLVKDSLDILAPFITRVVNVSLSTGYFPSSFKTAHVSPLIKKPDLDPEELKNYRPVSNLSFVSKVVEKVVASRLSTHLSNNNLLECMQSAYKSNHSVETALLRVHNDIMQAVDDKKVVLLILLDLSAAFDTIDHHVLLTRLHDIFGVGGVCLKWFASYLRDRYQSVNVSSEFSPRAHLEFGVPQGSVLGPQLFTLYTAPIAEIARRHRLRAHFYADDTQLYIAFSPREPGDEETVLCRVRLCLKDIRQWMLVNRLKLNDSKTDFLIICSQSMRPMVNTESILVGDADISSSSVSRNLGVLFDCNMDFRRHVNKICQLSYFQLRRISSIRRCLDGRTAECLVHAFITSRLDSCNSLLVGLPQKTLDKLQAVMNAAARLVVGAKKNEHITPILRKLHWLPVHFRIQYKVLLLVYKALHGTAPKYLQDLLQKRSTRPGLRSTDMLLHIPRTRLVGYGDRAFCYIGPKLWNSLPVDMRTIDSHEMFKSSLKTFLFERAFPG